MEQLLILIKEHQDDEINLDQADLLRFLKAKNGHPEKTFNKILNYHQWLNNIKLCDFDHILPELQTGKVLLMNRDKNNRKVILIRINQHLAGQIEHQKTIDLVLRICFYIDNYSPQGVIIIIDFQNFGYNNLDLGLPKKIGHLITKYFPGYVHQFLFINTPSLAMTFWKWIKPIIPKKHLEKIEFLKNTSDLLDIIDQQYLHQSYGGQWEKEEIIWIKETIEKLEKVEKIEKQ